MVDKPRHIPYEEEAQLMLDVVNFFVQKLPHAIESTAQHFDEAALASTLFGRLSQMTDDELAERGLHRDDISKAAAAAAHLFGVAKKVNEAKK
ncbi:MAG: hypothetical protein GEU76_08885 [Alphaproteobacteria bacterium]|jgi:hypothetical protein|nr:hypothetical protein [Alphaproteobacteria bacterium]